MKTGFTAMRLGMAAYLVPFIFVYWPAPDDPARPAIVST
jgi:TRAP-type uncharacterized transport system fused permease subunit